MPIPGIDLGVGSIAFEQGPLQAVPNGDGVRITLPTWIEMRWTKYPAPRPMLHGIRANIRLASAAPGVIELGQAVDPGFYLPPEGGVEHLQGNLGWQASLATLAVIERARNGQAPRFDLDVVGLVSDCHAVTDNAGRPREALSTPQWVGRPFTVTYSADAWVTMRRQAGVSHHVLLDIPFPPAAPTGWEVMWRHITDAIASFEQGGRVAWKNCVASVREALTEWGRLDPPDVSQPDSRARTLEQRVDHLRYELRNLAHLGPHGAAEAWTREDAVLALATLSALLARRRP